MESGVASFSTSRSEDNDFWDLCCLSWRGINNALLHSKHRKFGKINMHNRQRCLRNSILLWRSDENIESQEPYFLSVVQCRSHRH